MAKSKWILLALAAVFSGLSVTSLAISFISVHWVNSEAIYDDQTFPVDAFLQASYGLFSGHFHRYALTSSARYDLKIVCNYGSNKCFYSCQQTSEKQTEEYEKLMNDEDLANCPVSTTRFVARRFNEQVNMTATTTNETADTSSWLNMNQMRASAENEKEFLSAGLWLTTVIFLALTIAFAALTVIFSLVNIWFHPVQFIFGVSGLYIWNGIAIGMCCLTMIFWTSLYFIFISTNIAITETLRSSFYFKSSKMSNLGWSFWILFMNIVCHLINIGFIYYRSYLLAREPKAPAITVNKNDSTLLVY